MSTKTCTWDLLVSSGNGVLRYDGQMVTSKESSLRAEGL